MRNRLAAWILSGCMAVTYGLPGLGWGKDLRVPEQFPTINAAVQAAAADDRILITRPDQFKESIRIDKSLSLIADPPGARIESPEGAGVGIGAGAGRVSLEGLTIQNCAREGIMLAVPASLSMRKCVLSQNAQQGFLCEFKRNDKDTSAGLVRIDIDECSFSSNAREGLFINSPANFTLAVNDSMAESNRECGIRLQADRGYRGEFNMNKSLVRKNTEGGIRLDKGVRMKLVDCEVKENDGDGIGLSPDEKEERLGGGNPAGARPDGAVPIYLERCTIQSNKRHGIAMEGVSSRKLTVAGSIINQNGVNGFNFNNEPGVRVEVDLSATSISGNKETGLYSESPVTFDFKKCELRENGRNGVQCTADRGKSSQSKDLTRVMMDDCSVTSNSEYGILINGGINYALDVSNTAIEYNKKHGIRLTADLGYSGKTSLINAKINQNRDSCISCEHPAGLDVIKSQLSNNRSCGIDITASQSENEQEEWANVNLEDSSLRGNEKSGIEANGKRNLKLTSIRTSFDENGTDGVRVAMEPRFKCEVAIANASISRNKGRGVRITCPCVVKFRGCRIAKNTTGGLCLYQESGDLAFDPNRLARVDLEDSTVTLNDYAGVSVSGSLSADLRARRVVVADNLAHGINLEMKYPDSAQLDLSSSVIKANRGYGIHMKESLAVKFVRQPDQAGKNHEPAWDGGWVSEKSCIRMADTLLAENTSGTLCLWKGTQGTISLWAGMVLGESTTKCELAAGRIASLAPLARLAETIDKPAATEPPEKSGAVSRRATHHDPDGFNSFLRRSQALADLLQQAEAWHRLGNAGHSRKCQEMARRVRLGFSPGDSFTHNLPPELQKAEEQCNQTLGAEPTDDVGQLLKRVSADGDTTKSLASREYLTLAMLYFAGQSRATPELPDQPSATEVKGDVMQVFLEDLVEVLRHDIPEGLFTQQMIFLDNYFLESYSVPERLAALDWLDKQATSVIKADSRLACTYHLTMARMYRNNGGSSQEAGHLGAFAGLAPKSDQAVVALDRLTDLYLDFWKLPDKAIEAQRTIVSNFPEGERNLQARLRIGKILYEQKDYDRAITELTLLTSKMARDFDDKPVRTVLGLAYLGAGYYEDARNEFAQVINADQGEYRVKYSREASDFVVSPSADTRLSNWPTSSVGSAPSV